MITRSQVTGKTVGQVLNQYKELSRNGFDYVDHHQNGPSPRSPQERQQWRDHLRSADGIGEITTACEYILSQDIQIGGLATHSSMRLSAGVAGMAILDMSVMGP